MQSQIVEQEKSSIASHFFLLSIHEKDAQERRSVFFALGTEKGNRSI
jgi:hypothetical protein